MKWLTAFVRHRSCQDILHINWLPVLLLANSNSPAIHLLHSISLVFWRNQWTSFGLANLKTFVSIHVDSVWRFPASPQSSSFCQVSFKSRLLNFKIYELFTANIMMMNGLAFWNLLYKFWQDITLPCFDGYLTLYPALGEPSSKGCKEQEILFYLWRNLIYGGNGFKIPSMLIY